MICNSTRDDFPRLQAIADVCFGKRFLDYTSYRQPISINYQIDGVIVGFATASIGYASELGRRVGDLLPNEKVGILCNICVLPEYAGRGIGTALTAERCRRLESQVPRIIATAWKQYQTGIVNAAITLGRNDFKVVGEVEKPYAGMPCIVCGDSCKCSVVVYSRERSVDVSGNEGQQRGVQASDGTGEEDRRLVASVEEKHSCELV
jgi:ribosomal protein S18 acetylase RimI-like enzyme